MCAVTPWGAGSSVTGAALPVRGGIALDMGEMNRIEANDETNLLVKVQAGVIGGDLENTLNKHGYTRNHSPQSLYRSTVGGWIATRATEPPGVWYCRVRFLFALELIQDHFAKIVA